MTQEQFGLHWSQAQEVVSEQIDGYHLICVQLPALSIWEPEGFAACFVGRAGGFAGSFILRMHGDGVDLKGRWCAPSGAWYSFRRSYGADNAVDQLIAFTRRVVHQADDFDADEFGSLREE